MGRISGLLGRRGEAVRLLAEGRSILRGLAARDTGNAELQLQLAVAETQLAWTLASGDRVAATHGAQAAESLLTPLASRANAERRYGVELAWVHLLKASLHERASETGAARAAYGQSLQALGPRAAGDELRALEARARALAGMGSRGDARKLVAQLEQTGYREPAFVRFAAGLATEIRP
jgi:hypothetical protein